jgi:hypothetical protein
MIAHDDIEKNRRRSITNWTIRPALLTIWNMLISD